MNPSTIFAADLFCGCGGASAGLHRAAERIGAQVNLVAVNHWSVAIETHSANYPDSVHLLTEVENVNPRTAVPGGRLNLLLAGPSCTHFSQARGGLPVSDQQRSGAWDVIRWARDLHIENILVENVPEFQTWGPLRQKRNEQGELLYRMDVSGDSILEEPLMEPDPERKAMYFRQWVRMLRDMGYTVEWRVFCAAHYGDATTRKRLFIQCRRGGRIHWPKPTHMPAAEAKMTRDLKTWRSAREIIDWSLPSKSIFNRKRPLAQNTLKRILAGLEKFCGLSFVIGQQSCAAPRSTDEPIPTIAAAGAISLVQPFLVILKGTKDRQLQQSISDIESPLPTIHGSGGHAALCQPFVVVNRKHGCGPEAETHSIDDPLRTLTTGGNMALCEPFILPQFSTSNPRSVDIPLHTIVAQSRGNALILPYLVGVGGPQSRHDATSIDVPLPTILGQNHTGLVEPYLINYYGNGDCLSVDDPLDTITARDRFGVVLPMLDKGDRVALLDIHFRMLQPQELAAAHSFPTDYHFAGGREDRVKQVGNSWPVRLAEALCLAILTDGQVTA